MTKKFHNNDKLLLIILL